MSDRSQIEPATIDDIEAAVRLIALVNPQDLGSAAAWHHRLAVEPERARRLMLRATAEGELVGWGTSLLDTHTTTAGVAYVSATVHPDHRGRGLARRLTGKLIHRQAHRAEIPFLHVLVENTGAIALYEHLGFRARYQSLARAHASGIELAFTENDETNRVMLTVNERIGYRPSSARVTFSRP